jgi:hypothetical protein
MPEISRFFGIVIRMYFDDHGRPHFHAVYAGMKAKVALTVEWASIHRAELLENWHRLRSKVPALPIPPLE